MPIHIKNVFEKFERDVHELAFNADIVKESYGKYLSEIEENKKNNLRIDFYSSKRPVYFDVLSNNKKISSDLRVDKTLEQTYDDIFFHYNKQMQWFLVEAYEMYEDFVEKLYAVMGYLDNDFWYASDFGEIQLSKIGKSEDWFFEKIKKKKDKPYSILEVFEKRLSLTKYFDKKVPETNYNFIMQFIAEFRHAIVHERGFLDKTVLRDKLIGKKGINGKELVQKYEEYIDFYYGKDEYKSLICLTTISVNDIPVLPIILDRRSILTQYILSFAYLLTQLSIKYLEENKKCTKQNSVK